MGEGEAGEISGQNGDESQLVESPELAHEMAQVEITPRDKLKIAAELGLSDEAIQKMGLEIDQASQEKKEKYEWAMEKAEGLLINLLSSPKGEVKEKVEPIKSDTEVSMDELHDLNSALYYRTKFIDVNGELKDKIFNLQGEQRSIKFWTDRDDAGKLAMILRFEPPA